MKNSRFNLNLAMMIVVLLYVLFFAKMDEMKPLLLENTTNLTIIIIVSVLIFLCVNPIVAVLLVIISLEILKMNTKIYKTTTNVPNPILNVEPDNNIVDNNNFTISLEEEIVKNMIRDNNLTKNVDNTASYKPIAMPNHNASVL